MSARAQTKKRARHSAHDGAVPARGADDRLGRRRRLSDARAAERGHERDEASDAAAATDSSTYGQARRARTPRREPRRGGSDHLPEGISSGAGQPERDARRERPGAGHERDAVGAPERVVGSDQPKARAGPARGPDSRCDSRRRARLAGREGVASGDSLGGRPEEALTDLPRARLDPAERASATTPALDGSLSSAVRQLEVRAARQRRARGDGRRLECEGRQVLVSIEGLGRTFVRERKRTSWWWMAICARGEAVGSGSAYGDHVWPGSRCSPRD